VYRPVRSVLLTDGPLVEPGQTYMAMNFTDYTVYGMKDIAEFEKYYLPTGLMEKLYSRVQLVEVTRLR
jgi:hypothetical protein